MVYQTKLVGLIVSSNLSWGPHVDYTAVNASKKLWLLVRFKNRGGSQDQLLTLYQLKIRSIAEFAAPAFHGALTVQQSNDLEMIQKKAFAIILGLKVQELYQCVIYSWTGKTFCSQSKTLSELLTKVCEK